MLGVLCIAADDMQFAKSRCVPLCDCARWSQAVDQRNLWSVAPSYIVCIRNAQTR